MIPLCGGNIDTTILGRCLERGLAADENNAELQSLGKRIRDSVVADDAPHRGSVAAGRVGAELQSMGSKVARGSISAVVAAV